MTAWSRYDNRWRGVLVSDLLALVRPKPEARFVLLQSYDTYTTNLPLDEFAVPDALLATHWEGEPLTVEHGGPLRVVVPQLYFWKSAKWVKRITFAADRPARLLGSARLSQPRRSRGKRNATASNGCHVLVIPKRKSASHHL